MRIAVAFDLVLGVAWVIWMKFGKKKARRGSVRMEEGAAEKGDGEKLEAEKGGKLEEGVVVEHVEYVEDGRLEKPLGGTAGNFVSGM